MNAAPQTFTTRIDAEAWLAGERRVSEDPGHWRAPKVRVEEEQDRQAQLQRQTFGRYASDWLTHRELAASTRHTYGQLLKHHLLPRFAEIPLTQIDRATVASWHRSTGPVTPHARKHAHDLLRNILNAAAITAQIISAVGYCAWFPWAVPALMSGVAARTRPLPGSQGSPASWWSGPRRHRDRAVVAARRA